MNCQCCDSEPCLEALDNALSCIYCGQPVLQARWEAGYHYCFNPICAHELRSRQEQYRLILVPKQGFTYVEADSPHLLEGRSSGRQ
jgi:hypothetical protein